MAPAPGLQRSRLTARTGTEGRRRPRPRASSRASSRRCLLHLRGQEGRQSRPGPADGLQPPLRQPLKLHLSATHGTAAARLRPRKNLASRRNRRARAAQAVRRTSAPHQRLPHGTRARPRANCRHAPCATNALHENAHLPFPSPFPLHPQLICVVLFRLLLLY